MNDNQKVTSHKLNFRLRMDLQAAQIAIQAIMMVVLTKNQAFVSRPEGVHILMKVPA